MSKVEGASEVSFGNEVQRTVRRRAHGTCECTNSNCPHFGRCRQLGTEFRAKTPLDAGGADHPGNCQLVCKSCQQRLGTSRGTTRL